jgi:hypothetical protein
MSHPRRLLATLFASANYVSAKVEKCFREEFTRHSERLRTPSPLPGVWEKATCQFLSNAIHIDFSSEDAKMF